MCKWLCTFLYINADNVSKIMSFIHKLHNNEIRIQYKLCCCTTNEFTPNRDKNRIIYYVLFAHSTLLRTIIKASYSLELNEWKE